MPLSRALFFGSLSCLALGAYAQAEDDFPDLIVRRGTFTVDAQGAEPLYDVDLMIWKGALPDTLQDTLRFFARYGTTFHNENMVNRMRCANTAWDIMDQRYPSDEARLAAAIARGDLDQDGTADENDLELYLRDSLALHYPEIATRRLHLLSDTAMRFVENRPAAADQQFLATPPIPLRSLILPDHWYLYTLFGEGSIDGGFRHWLVWFQVDHQGHVQEWHEAKKHYAGSGQVRKL